VALMVVRSAAVIIMPNTIEMQEKHQTLASTAWACQPPISVRDNRNSISLAEFALEKNDYKPKNAI